MIRFVSFCTGFEIVFDSSFVSFRLISVSYAFRFVLFSVSLRFVSDSFSFLISSCSVSFPFRFRCVSFRFMFYSVAFRCFIADPECFVSSGHINSVSFHRGHAIVAVDR